MSELTLYTHPLNQPGRSVAIFCKLSGIEFAPKPMNIISGETSTEEFTRINPFQMLPAIVHNGYNVWESAAIISYLADVYNVDNQWYPKDIKIRARINAYLHWHHQNVRDPVSDYLRVKVGGPKYFGLPELTPEAEVPYRQKLNNCLENFTWVISETRYVARTSTPTIADIFAINELHGLKYLGVSLDNHPAIKSWYDEIRAISKVNEILSQAEEIVSKVLA